MPSDTLITLQITLWGMAFVFLALFFVWILVSIISLLGNRVKSNKQVEDQRSNHQKAAALAVAICLAELEQERKTNLKLPPTAIISAWQLSLRTNQMKRNRPLYD